LKNLDFSATAEFLLIDSFLENVLAAINKADIEKSGVTSTSSLNMTFIYFYNFNFYTFRMEVYIESNNAQLRTQNIKYKKL
jgi:hypothetical protein